MSLWELLSNAIMDPCWNAPHSACGADWKVPVNKPRSRAVGATRGGRSEEMFCVVYHQTRTALWSGSHRLVRRLAEGYMRRGRSARDGYNIHSFLYNHLHGYDKIKKQVLSAQYMGYTGHSFYLQSCFFFLLLLFRKGVEPRTQSCKWLYLILGFTV